jgi:ATP-dependent helicase/nuclease subunit A
LLSFTAATNRAAKTSVSALRREAAELLDEEAQPLIQSKVQSLRSSFRGGRTKSAKLSASEIGTVHHKFLQPVALERAGDAEALKRETAPLECALVLSPEEIAALDFKALAVFEESDLGREIRANAPHVRRELAFTARFTPTELAAITGEKPDSAMEGEFVVVQGVAELVVLLPDPIRLMDFKTDELKPGELADKVRLYKPQLKLYGLALSRIYECPVMECWLRFLALQKSARVEH